MGVLFTTGVLGTNGDETVAVTPLPMQTTTVADERDAEPVIAAARLGFPTFATKNTTRVGGGDPIENAAAVALAAFPSTGESRSPEAVTLVPSESWSVALAAAALAATPISAPILIAGPDGLGELTEGALAALAPKGGPATAGRQVFTVGAVPAPEGFATQAVEGASTAELAAGLARLRRQLTGTDPGAFLVISEADPGYAMPAAAWSARSGDPTLISEVDEVPEATAKLLAMHPGVPVFMLGPESVLSRRVERQLGRGGRPVTRISAGDPVSNAIEFARFSQGGFGWNINDPGHGLVVTHVGEPLNAAAAAPLSAAGTWGPLLLTNDAAVVPGALRSYLLDIKPGYRDDPTRALYNHIWLIGDQQTIEVSQQATLDQLAELEQIGDVGTAAEPSTEDVGTNPARSGNNQGDDDAGQADDASEQKGQQDE